MKRALAVALVLATALPAWAQGEDDEAADEEEEEEEDAPADDEEEEEEEEEEAKPEPKAKPEEEEEEEDDDGLRAKQNLTGHDLGTNKESNEFERDRFFVDKVDTEKTENGTLVQGSISSSTFLYAEKGGAYPGEGGVAPNLGDNTGPKRIFTELRLQTDFRHISGSRWEARVDARARLVPQPDNPTATTPDNSVQSGLTGDNEYDIRELWITRVGARSDIFLGRQFVPDLGAVKFDGLRIDYAKSAKLTFIGFGGLFPVRGSRSLDTDYMELKAKDGSSAGRFVGIGGFGGAYRTVNAYGALGTVVQVPLSKEQPRIYVTSNGYLRNGAKLDVFHFALVDLLGDAAQESTGRIQLTNLSGGLNFKPNPRLRLTASFHRVDTETLSVQAGAFLQQPDTTPGGNSAVQNEAYLLRLATNAARAGVSAGLGKQQRFEISTAISLRHRPKFTLVTPDPAVMDVELPAAQSVEVWGSVADRTSIKNTRIGLEVSRSFGVGALAYQRSEALLVRGYALRPLAEGRGEWEAEVSYTGVKDSVLGTMINCAGVADCYGTSNNTLLSAGGQLFYRLRRDWFGIGTLHVLRITNTRSDGRVDPAVLGITGFVRIAKRF